MDKNIPLSVLIRIGAKISPQCIGWTYRAMDGSTCALGAAYMAKFGEIPPPDTRRCREALGISFYLSDRIVNLNDGLKWSREKIAETLEGQGL